MGNFQDTLDCCCECYCNEDDEYAGFKEPDLWRYFNAPMANDMYGALVSTVDFNFEQTKNGIKVAQASSPLIPEPKFMGSLSSQKQMPPLRQLQQDDDLGKRDSGKTSGKPNDPQKSTETRRK